MIRQSERYFAGLSRGEIDKLSTKIGYRLFDEWHYPNEWNYILTIFIYTLPDF